MHDLFVTNIMMCRFVFVVIIFVEFDFPCDLVVFRVFCRLEELFNVVCEHVREAAVLMHVVRSKWTISDQTLRTILIIFVWLR